MKIVCLGSLVRDNIYKVPHFVLPGETLPSDNLQIFLGGKGLNQAVALKRAGFPEVYLAGGYGTDGAEFLTYLDEQKIDHRFLYPVKMPNGHAVIQLTPQGQNAIVHYSGSNRHLPEVLVDNLLDFLEEGDFLVAQNEVNLLPELFEALPKKGVKIAFNPSPCDESAQKLPLKKAAYLIVNEVEGECLSGLSPKDPIAMIAALVKKYKGASIILTLGADGSYFSDGQETLFQKAYHVVAVDTVGAGDTFAGYLFAALAGGIAPKDAMDLSARAAAISVTRHGAAPSIPKLSEVLQTKF